MRRTGVDPSWEKIYRAGKQMNQYPHDQLVRRIARIFFNIPFPRRRNIKILDLGCGAGNNALFLAEQGFDVYGIDGSKAAIRECRSRFAKKGLRGTFVNCDLKQLPFPNKAFNCVVDRESLYANSGEDIKTIIAQVWSKLKKNGLFISFIFNNMHPQKRLGIRFEDGSYHQFKKGSFSRSGKAHFFNLREVFEFYRKFHIQSIMRHSCRELFKEEDNSGDLDEYIIVAKK